MFKTNSIFINRKMFYQPEDFMLFTQTVSRNMQPYEAMLIMGGIVVFNWLFVNHHFNLVDENKKLHTKIEQLEEVVGNLIESQKEMSKNTEALASVIKDNTELMCKLVQNTMPSTAETS